MFNLKKVIIWLAAALCSVLLTICIFFPAAWLAPLLDYQTKGRLVLGDAQGSLWQGSAFIGAAASDKEMVTPLLMGRFSWHISPLVLFGQIQIMIENAEVLSTAVEIHGSWKRWEISPVRLSLPAQYLVALGAPLNTIQPSGELRLAWQKMTFTRIDKNQIEVEGNMTLDMLKMASRLSPVKPFGSYRLDMQAKAGQTRMTLSTLNGPLLLSGSGKLESGHFSFSGVAETAVEQQERLETLLSLLGQSRRKNGRNIVELEFTS